MPFVSQAQRKWAFSKSGFGKEKALEWARETPNIKALPERVSMSDMLGKKYGRKSS